MCNARTHNVGSLESGRVISHNAQPRSNNKHSLTRTSIGKGPVSAGPRVHSTYTPCKPFNYIYTKNRLHGKIIITLISRFNSFGQNDNLTFNPSFPGKVPSDRLEKFLVIYVVNESYYENHYNYNIDNDGATVSLYPPKTCFFSTSCFSPALI